jgi:hypothetical protein
MVKVSIMSLLGGEGSDAACFRQVARIQKMSLWVAIYFSAS